MPNFTNLADMAKILKREEKEVMALVESKEIPGECYCFPDGFGGGHDIAFYSEKTVEAVKSMPKEKEKEAPDPRPFEKEEDQGETPSEQEEKKEGKKGKK